MRSWIAVILFLLLTHTPAGAIVRRHDVPDQDYQDAVINGLSIINFNLLGDEKPADGMGALIAPDWILTAAHLEDLLKPDHEFLIDDEAVVVKRVISFPDWEDEHHDIALVQLKAPVMNMTPAVLMRDNVVEGEEIFVTGYGDYGDGKTGSIGNDRVLRAAYNRIDVVSEKFIKFRFDGPNDPNVLPLEGISGPGDSGGPGYVLRDGQWLLAGVGAAQSTRDTDGKEGVYGVVEYYMHIPSYLEWIDETLAKYGA